MYKSKCGTKLFNTGELAALTGVSQSLIRRLVRKGVLPTPVEWHKTPYGALVWYHSKLRSCMEAVEKYKKEHNVE